MTVLREVFHEARSALILDSLREGVAIALFLTALWVAAVVLVMRTGGVM
jgi:hypothetical protein